MAAGSGRTDVLTEEQRRRCMSAIRGRDTSPEQKLRKHLWSQGYRYRIGHGLPGKPDIVFPSRRVVIFVDGCFWHRCPVHFRQPKTNQQFWEAKISRNVARDTLVTGQLSSAGWVVIRIWEHDLRQNFDAVVAGVIQTLQRKSD